MDTYVYVWVVYNMFSRWCLSCCCCCYCCVFLFWGLGDLKRDGILGYWIAKSSMYIVHGNTTF